MPTAHSIRREPLRQAKGLSAVTGFTVVELMVAVAVIAVAASLAIPSLQSREERRDLAETTRQVAGFFSQAQVESVMRGEPLTLSLHRSDVNGWCLGLKAGDRSCDCTEPDPGAPDFCSVDSVPRLLSDDALTNPGILDSLLSDGAVTFDPASGTLTEPEDMIEMAFISDSGQYALTVQLESTGELRICARNSALQPPGFGLC